MEKYDKTVIERVVSHHYTSNGQVGLNVHLCKRQGALRVPSSIRKCRVYVSVRQGSYYGPVIYYSSRGRVQKQQLTQIDVAKRPAADFPSKSVFITNPQFHRSSII